MRTYIAIAVSNFGSGFFHIRSQFMGAAHACWGSLPQTSSTSGALEPQEQAQAAKAVATRALTDGNKIAPDQTTRGMVL
jgi:hypothetical protein